MRRWNGWGDESIDHPLPAAAEEYLVQAIGPGTPPRDATLVEVLSRVPAAHAAFYRAATRPAVDSVFLLLAF